MVYKNTTGLEIEVLLALINNYTVRTEQFHKNTKKFSEPILFYLMDKTLFNKAMKANILVI